MLSGFEVGAAHALVDHLLHRQRRVPAHVHADLEEHHGDAGVLADRAVALGAHARVDQNLGDGVLGGRALLALVGCGQRLDVVDRVVVADVLEGVGDALDEIFLTDGGSWVAFQCCFAMISELVMNMSVQAMVKAET